MHCGLLHLRDGISGHNLRGAVAKGCGYLGARASFVWHWAVFHCFPYVVSRPCRRMTGRAWPSI